MDKDYVYAFIGTREGDGIIGLGSAEDGVPIPMVFMTYKMAKQFYPMVMGFCKAKNIEFRLVRYENPKDIGDEIYQQLKEEGFKY